MDKAVVIFSGGMDSVVLLNKVAQDYEVYGISFDYGQRHKKELDFAKYWGDTKCKEHKIIKLDFMKEFGVNSALLNDDIKVPEEHYTNDNQKLTVVPNRNMVMLSIAVAYAEGIGAKQVFYGAHKNDFTIYPDCRPSFVEALDEASVIGTYNHVQIVAPYVNELKAKIAADGAEMGIDFTKTWSCYKGSNKHCGKCGTCQERQEAFKLAEVKDFTEYD